MEGFSESSQSGTKSHTLNTGIQIKTFNNICLQCTDIDNQKQCFYCAIWSGFVQLTSTFVFMCSHLSGGEMLLEQEKKKKKNFQECLEFCNMSYIFQLSSVVGVLCYSVRGAWRNKKQTEQPRIYFSFLWTGQVRKEIGDKLALEITSAGWVPMCSLKQNDCNSNWKVVELTWHSVLTADCCILDRVRQEAAER